MFLYATQPEISLKGAGCSNRDDYPIFLPNGGVRFVYESQFVNAATRKSRRLVDCRLLIAEEYFKPASLAIVSSLDDCHASLANPQISPLPS